MRDLADRLIAERRCDPALGRCGDLLDVMLTAADHKTGEMLGDDNIRSQLMTFLVAGHETTSGLVSFAIWLLLNSPQALARARAQVDAVLGAETPTVGRIAQLKYVERLLMETLRLWPTAPDFAVRPLAETVTGGRYRVTPDDILFVLLPILHRDPAVWDAPEAFRPERFEQDKVEKLPPNVWKPFGHGRRSCIGRGFAMQEAALVLAMILQRFDLGFADPGYRLKVGETLTEAGRPAHPRPPPQPRNMPLAWSNAATFIDPSGHRTGRGPGAMPGHAWCPGRQTPKSTARANR